MLGGPHGYRVQCTQAEGALFDQTCSVENLFAAWEKFRRGKRSRADVLAFERHLEDRLFTLRDDLLSGAYRHGPYQRFIVHDPKKRTIHKAAVRDRLVHQAVVSILGPIFERRFIADSFSCRVGRGTHAGIARLRSFLRKTSWNNTRTVYALKFDIQRFFDSVAHAVLYCLLTHRIGDSQLLALLRDIVGSFSVAFGRGLPLGNLTSQLFANVYLHELDWFVKQQLRERWYVRYCDDAVIVSPDREHLESLVPKLDAFLREHLRVGVHPAKVALRTWSQGVDFLGYVLLPHCTVLRTKTARRMLRRARSVNLSSYLGLCSHADAYELRNVLLSGVRGPE